MNERYEIETQFRRFRVIYRKKFDLVKNLITDF